ncbi:SCO family protein [Lentibacter algarum]|uniref:SCO family protein n=1 Tax=Lentibacter algarum TaxID=576131 RepID=UPI001C078470|nr:SCO family protein [Lentibacter algarum]MBU2980362.1 SCO family protein [Lentibacter algarum]
MSKKPLLSSAAVVTLVLAGGLGTLLAGTFAYTQFANSGDKFADCRVGAVAGGGGDIGGPFELVDETGKTVTDKDVITGPTLVYFGYTFCPDVCPLDASRNAEAVTLLQERGYSVKPVFISIDAERDTPEALAEFTDVMHPDMLGLTGTEEQLKQASLAYRTYFKKQPADDGDDDYYLIDHSTFSYFMLPDAGFVDFVRHEEPAEAVAKRLQCFLDKG